ncbi:ribose 5-phosphate isomerase B [Candidatus Soleaferrea massiliensis]|uniref:ribose 5-phosphate isomerase B n=1 Tax=Candidatus Soleaferrea massiliensis TaxID=1470354 RepID=UPI00058DD82F|nr:ribose 5-phosphate isomerase B [Candidatus Soleaferrea massiliensis]
MLAIGCDHGGFKLKESLKRYLEELNIEYKDFGCDGETCDYPDIAAVVAKAVASGSFEKGLLICGTGIGMSIAANKIRGIRAACCSDYYSAKYTRMHNNANILCLGGRIIGPGAAEELVDVFLNTEYEGGRHQHRLDIITRLEEESAQ